MIFRAVIFDLFGTLVETVANRQLDLMLEEVAGPLDLPAGELKRLWRETWRERSDGRFARWDDYFRRLGRSLGRELTQDQITTTYEVRLRFYRDLLVPRGDAIATLVEIRSRGLAIGLISDCSWEVPRIWPETAFAPLIELPIFSCAVKMTKPDPRIYELACRRLGVHPTACLYVGDGGSRELTGATAAGLTAVRIADPGEAAGHALRYDEDDWRGDHIVTLSDLLPLLDRS